MTSIAAPIVVGLNDAPGGRAALQFGIREAIRRGSPVDIVTAWTRSRARAQEVQDVAVAEAIERLVDLPVLSRRIVQGDPAQTLLRIARHADYLVLGRSRRSQSRHVLLGSVGEFCVRYSTCPVLVVPGPAVHTPDDEMEGDNS